jgi:hypothetical protein
MSLPSADTVDRTALLRAHGEQHATIEEALDAHSATGAAIVADVGMCTDPAGQAAVCTAIATAARAFGNTLVLADSGALVTVGPYTGSTLAQVVEDEGARLAEDLSELPPDWPIIVIGQCPEYLAESVVSRKTTVYVQWNGWIARVGPTAPPAAASVDKDAADNVIAAIGAAALAVHEAFGAAQARPGSDAGYRRLTLNLWRPGTEYDAGPSLNAAPAAWWLVGLGHLGQANAWVLSFLPYPDRSKIGVILQDDDFAVPANRSTGLLTPPDPDRMRKTRLVACVLDRLGFATSITEFRLDGQTRAGSREHHVALLGVDSLSARRLISDVSWKLAVDTGLGAGPTDFNSIMIRRFPGARRSDQVPAWTGQDEARQQIHSRAFEDAARRDECGAAELAGIAVGATFVGIIAACLAIAEAVRPLHNGDGHDALSVHLGSDDWDPVLSEVGVDIIPARLANHR